MAVGTAVALPVGVGGSGPSRSKDSCPCATGEATAAAALRPVLHLVTSPASPHSGLAKRKATCLLKA